MQTHLSRVDWIIFFLFVATLLAATFLTKSYTRSVSDFLAAGRVAGRYLICVSSGIAIYGAAGFIGQFQMYYGAGFTARWWDSMAIPAAYIMIMTGWVIYRYRQTKAMTLSQFLELRYSRKFRIFTGIISFISGILQFGIYPAVGARFFMWIGGMPEEIQVAGELWPSFPIVMLALLLISLFLTIWGGQITIIVTDFLQGTFCNIVFLTVVISMFFIVPWSKISETLLESGAGSSMIDPFDTANIKTFNIWYFIIGTFIYFYQYMSWQGTQAYNCCAKSPHEAKMAGILGALRHASNAIFCFSLPIIIYVVMKNPNFSQYADKIKLAWDNVQGDQLKTQSIVPIGIGTMLPTGLLGALAASVFCAFVSNHTTALHSWGAVLVQDVIMPFRNMLQSFPSYCKPLGG